ncbi:MAG: glycosyltransferase family 1 protein [Polyangiales bacterium]
MSGTTICIDCRYIRERPSGISPLVQALVDHVPGQCPEWSFLFLKHPKGPARLSPAPNVREVVVTQEANGPATLLWLSRIVDLRSVDLFHATFNILPRGLPMKTVVTLCDVMWMNHPEWCRDPGLWGHVQTQFFQLGIRQTLRSATRIAAISQATKDEIAKLDPRAAERTRITLLGVSEEFHVLDGPAGERAVDDARAKWLPGAKRYVLTVGQFAGYKNHERVVRAFAQAFADDPTVHLGLVQRLGEGQRTLQPIARDLGVGDRVHFLSGVPFPELVALYNGALCLCHPSLEEGFGNPPSEALACACPIVTSNRSSMPQVSGDAALFVDPESVDAIANALRRVATEPGLAAGMRERGLRRAKELSWRAFADANLAVYRETLSL